MHQDNAHQAYSEGRVLSNNPLNLVVALYEGAADAARSARICLESGDIWGRTKAINKAFGILSELLVSLDRNKGGEIAKNLSELYCYMQRRLTDAHIKQDVAPIKEVEGLLSTLLEGWKQAATQSALESAGTGLYGGGSAMNSTEAREETEMIAPYGGYWHEGTDRTAQTAYSF